jgi:hypothetical protein
MCCFSRPVESVFNTNIFARASNDGRQFIVYAMSIQMDQDLAMILPIPTPRKSPDDAVRFINLKGYPEFFDDMAIGFLEPSRGDVDAATDEAPRERPKLAVVDVGDFGASFVPSIGDFDRLDDRFRLPSTAWEALPQYRDYGFAVFKLKEGKAQEQQRVHPMAFEFPRAKAKQLFFPTVHIHDGEVHDEAEFDHVLYCQRPGGVDTRRQRWIESRQLASQFLKIDKCEGLVDGKNHIYQLTIQGERKNEDILV